MSRRHRSCCLPHRWTHFNAWSLCHLIWSWRWIDWKFTHTIFLHFRIWYRFITVYLLLKGTFIGWAMLIVWNSAKLESILIRWSYKSRIFINFLLLLILALRWFWTLRWMIEIRVQNRSTNWRIFATYFDIHNWIRRGLLFKLIFIWWILIGHVLFKDNK